MFKKLTRGAICCLSLLLVFPLSAQVSGYLGKRKAIGVYFDLTPALNPSTGTSRAIDQVNAFSHSFDGEFLGLHTRLGVEYATVTQRRKLWAFGADISRINYKSLIDLYIGDIPDPNKLTATVLKGQIEYRKFRQRHFGKESGVGLAPVGKFTGFGMRVGLLFPRVHNRNSEVYGLSSKPIIVPDIYFTKGKSRVISDKILLTNNIRVGFGFLYFWAKSEAGIFTTENQKNVQDALQYQSTLTDFVRLSVAVQMLR
jgi:hypothetical protein